MTPNLLLLLVLMLMLALLAGCRRAADLPPVVYPNEAALLNADAFIEQAVGLEWPQTEFVEEFGPGVVQERDDRLVMLYDCRDKRVVLTIDRAKFEAGVVHVDAAVSEAY